MVCADMRAIHEGHPEWGADSPKWRRGVEALIDRHDVETVLDYGAGKGRLGDVVRREVLWQNYDPAFDDVRPGPADLVVCTHVLEHVVDPDGELDNLRDLTRCVLFISIGTGAGRDYAPNRNVRTDWLDKLGGRFADVRCLDRPAFKRGKVRRGRPGKYLTVICEA